MATQYPTTIEELEKCQGVSKGKAIRYGKIFLDTIKKYVEEHNIIRPDDFVMKSVVNKSGLKVFIIQNVDKKMPLETIAKNKEISMSDLLDALENIVASGTKLNLDYCIDEELDEYAQDESLDYFKNCETSSLAIAKEELSEGNYTIEQLKLVRIKFLVEYGN
jgi:ATP-dependent DNA helicase RecQ